MMLMRVADTVYDKTFEGESFCGLSTIRIHLVGKTKFSVVKCLWLVKICENCVSYPPQTFYRIMVVTQNIKFSGIILTGIT